MDEENGIKLPPMLQVNPFVFRGGTRCRHMGLIYVVSGGGESDEGKG